MAPSADQKPVNHAPDALSAPAHTSLRSWASAAEHVRQPPDVRASATVGATLEDSSLSSPALTQAPAQSAIHRTAVSPAPTFSSPMQATTSQQAWESLDATGRALLTFLATHSMCPLTCLESFVMGAHVGNGSSGHGWDQRAPSASRSPRTSGTSGALDTQSRLRAMQAMQLVVQDDVPLIAASEQRNGVRHTQNMRQSGDRSGISRIATTDASSAKPPQVEPESVWSATQAGAACVFADEGCINVQQLVQGYEFGRRDHVRRPAHTRAVYEFFESVQRQAREWSRVTRRMDSIGKLNDGALGYYELEAFEDDVMARSIFMIPNGAYKRWQPDGYGVLRAGVSRYRFWLEIDGSTQGRAHNEADPWARKFDALCSYYVTRKWQLRHAVFPRLLIVTTDIRIIGVTRDVLAYAASTAQIAPPVVYLASSNAIHECGPLAQVWKAVHNPTDDAFGYAFEPMAAAHINIDAPNAPQRG